MKQNFQVRHLMYDICLVKIGEKEEILNKFKWNFSRGSERDFLAVSDRSDQIGWYWVKKVVKNAPY